MMKNRSQVPPWAWEGITTLPDDFTVIGAMVSAWVYALSFDWRIACRHPPYVFLQRLRCRIIGSLGAGRDVFFTVNLPERRFDTLVRHIDVLREVVRVGQAA
jgi:hypothetical protein